MSDLITTSSQLDQTITDIAGQLAPSSKRIYLNDTKYFAEWMREQGLTPDTMSRSDMIAYRQHLAQSTYAKATKQHMFRVAVRLMNEQDRKSTRLNSSHMSISYAVFCLKKK